MKKFKRLLIIILVIFAITSCKNSKIIENDNVNYCFFIKNIIWLIVFAKVMIAFIFLRKTTLYKINKKK